MRDVVGTFFNGGSSRKERVLLHCAADRLLSVLRGDGEKLAGPEPLSDVDISSRLGNTPRFIRFADGGVFETADNDSIDQLLSEVRPQSGLLYRLESKLRYALIGLLVTIVFVWGSVQYGIPAVAQYTAFALSPENNRRVGQGVLGVLDRFYVTPSRLPEEEQLRLRRRFLQFIGTADGIPIQVEFRNGAKSFGPNALALPSGTIVFTDQLVRLARHDEELMAVFAHEVGHVVRRHSMRHLLQNSALTAVVVAVTGDVSSVSSVIAAAPVLLVQSGYSRSFEREADRYAIQQMRQQGIDVAHFATMLRNLEKAHRCGERDERTCRERTDSQWNDYLSTHPPTDERVRMLMQE